MKYEQNKHFKTLITYIANNRVGSSYFGKFSDGVGQTHTHRERQTDRQRDRQTVIHTQGKREKGKVTSR